MKEKIKSTLTDKERREISVIVVMVETGSYLLRGVPDEMKDFFIQVMKLVTSKNKCTCQRDKEICDYYNACHTPEELAMYEEKYIY